MGRPPVKYTESSLKKVAGVRHMPLVKARERDKAGLCEDENWEAPFGRRFFAKGGRGAAQDNKLCQRTSKTAIIARFYLRSAPDKMGHPRMFTVLSPLW
jgi:hypothetical protein